MAVSGLVPLAQVSLAHAASNECLPAEDATILTLAARGERVAATLYERALAGAHFSMEETARLHLHLLQSAHMQHMQILRGLGASAQPSRVSVPRAVFGDASAFVRTGREIEATLAGLYMAAVRELAVLGHPDLAATAAQLGATAAQNGVVLSTLAGLAPQEVKRQVPSVSSVREAAQPLAAYLQDSWGAVRP